MQKYEKHKKAKIQKTLGCQILVQKREQNIKRLKIFKTPKIAEKALVPAIFQRIFR